MGNYVPKYRLYDKQDGKMQVVSGIIWPEVGANKDHVRTIVAGGRIYQFEVGAENWPVMQATGIRDKHGKEIYVGDLMKWDEKEWGDPYNETVEAHYDTWRESDWPEFCEIVGNIYQNPELVDKQR